MKTKKRTFNAIIIGILLCSLPSCVSSYRQTTKINPDGSCVREIYAKGDSAFLAGNRSSNPYLFQLDASWTITLPDTVKDEGYNVKISKTFRHIGEFSAGLQFDEELRPLVAPVETLQKRFRWFYTTYTFQAVYPSIAAKIPVSIDRYMSKDEQRLWFQGDFSAFGGMNGWELKDELDTMEKQFLRWYSQNVYEVYFEVIGDFEKLSGNSPYASCLPAAKDSLFHIIAKNDISSELDIADFCRELDKYFKTNRFSDFYRENKQEIDAKCGKRLLSDLFSNEIEYQLTVPGKLIHANTSLIRQDTLTWKITAMRLIPGDYTLTATSRTVHPWAFVVVFFFAGLFVYYLIRILRT
jgi:hypothetical protein